jgi:hypothetical protein
VFLNLVLYLSLYVFNKIKVQEITKELDIKDSSDSEIILSLVRSVRGSVILYLNKGLI